MVRFGCFGGKFWRSFLSVVKSLTVPKNGPDQCRRGASKLWNPSNRSASPFARKFFLTFRRFRVSGGWGVGGRRWWGRAWPAVKIQTLVISARSSSPINTFLPTGVGGNHSFTIISFFYGTSFPSYFFLMHSKCQR